MILHFILQFSSSHVVLPRRFTTNRSIRLSYNSKYAPKTRTLLHFSLLRVHGFLPSITILNSYINQFHFTFFSHIPLILRLSVFHCQTLKWPIEFTHTTRPHRSIQLTLDPSTPASEKPAPPPGSYVVQIPKDQIFRVPPPENAGRYQQYTHKKNRRSSCCCCFCWLLGVIITLIVLLAIAAGIFYLVFKPESPNYTVERISIKGMNISTLSSTATISPEFDVAVRANNPNDKIGNLLREEKLH
ncbi:Late embryogenesis abundant hydroxyproline-rich glycoprotein [Quillaja saponaria]|uniref:Late embryogenesis abundant hydroxyproline-rich glycoprotein n=1 Tax=Quillaja saponaria TaxID=32244 RepID=A0AAD7PMP2_QUISA|nr:Late embryogenesis abundant hydroxyproline-rich glycoprotein [Quillaja saponaria]